MNDGPTAAIDAARSPADLVQEWVVTLVQHSLVVFELALGNYESALALAPTQADDAPLGEITFPDVIEAAVRSGDRATAIATLTRFSSGAIETGTPVALGLLARSRALLASDTDAAGLYEDAIRRLEDAQILGQVARTRLLYGEWLRRRGRRVEARRHLRAALDSFLAVGATAFAERARGELAATNERARRRTDETRRALTPQEARVAELASQGATNPEIGAKLFISSHTVDYHLRKVFRKLDLTSRRQLATLLAG